MRFVSRKPRYLASFVVAVAASFALFAASGCSLDRFTYVSKLQAATAPPANTSGAIVVAGPNAMSVVVNGDGKECGFTDNKTLNMPCVSVTICAPGTSQCQTIPNILLDTGSWGLRIFRYSQGTTPLLTVPLVPETKGQNTIAECVTYLGSNTQWGPVMYADIELGGEGVIAKLPIHVLDSSTVGAKANCSTIDPSTGDAVAPTDNAEDAGFNGILGVGLNIQDCGEACTGPALNPNNDPLYYSCNATSCSPAPVPLADQVANPVAMLPGDNNGIVIELPGVPANGASSVTGSLVFGIGTELNNQPGGVTTYGADTSGSQFGGRMQTVFSPYASSAMPGFLDSGSSLISFPANSGANSVTDCGATDQNYVGLFCPSTATNFSATNSGINGTSGAVSFTIMSALDLIDTGNIVFSDMASNSFPVDPSSLTATPTTPYFDWGLPFFLGRSIYIGFNGAKSPLGYGPFWAFH